MILGLFRNKEKELEKAKTKLILNLEHGDIDFLITQMMNTDVYSPLLNKKRKTEYSNTDEVRWYAYRRAEKLNSLTDKEQLFKKLSAETNPSIKSQIYFCLAHFCTNTTDKELFNFLMDKLEAEDDESKRKILIGLQEMKKDADLNIEPLKKLAEAKLIDIKTNAILALKHTHDNQVQDLLLTLFEETKDSHRKAVICTTLKTIGTAKSIPILQTAFKKTRDYGLRYDIEELIGIINEKENISKSK